MALVCPAPLDPGMRDAQLGLEAEASRLYSAFVYDSDAQSRTVQAALFDAGAGEGAARFVVSVVDEDTLAGMFCGLTGAELAGARMRATMVLRRMGLLQPDSPLPGRIKAAAGALWKIEPEDLYLARIAVAPAFRGRGVADALMGELLRRADAEGRRVLLEVAPDNAAARHLYTRHGFGMAEARAVEHHGRKLEMLLAERRQ